MNLHDIQRLAWENKLAKGFNTTNVDQEFALTFTEVGEAYDAWRRSPETLAGELADALIFLTGIASMTGVDLDQAVQEKLAKNAARTYRRNAGGHLVKAEAVQ